MLAGNGRVEEYVGGYSDWLRQRPPSQADGQPTTKPKVGGAAGAATGTRGARPKGTQSTEQRAGKASANKGAPKPAKLSYKDQRALEQLPQQIEALEAVVEQLHATLGDPALYQGPATEVTATQARLAEVEAELAECYDRWEALEAAQEALR